MSTPALYLKYRPQSFAGLAGQSAIVSTLLRALKSGRAAHAYLFTGPRGTGKTTTARLLAKGLNCLKPKAGEPDNVCELCKAINAGSLLDVIEVDAASNRGIDEIRELRDKVQYAPSQAKRKVYIIDEVHMLTKEAFNALLKTLEEPPEHAVFILATTEPHKVPQTIISRCQRFDFKPATVPVIAEQLAGIAKSEKLELGAEAAELIARAARGSYRDGLSILDLLASGADGAITAEVVREVLGLANLSAVAELERALVAGDRLEAIKVIRRAAEQGIAPETFRTALVEYLRSLMLAAAGAPAAPAITKLAADWTLTRLTAAVRSFVEAADVGAIASAPELPLELATLEFLGDVGTSKQSVIPSSANGGEESVTKTDPRSLDSVPTSRDSARDNKKKPAAPTPPASASAQQLWEQLLIATKEQYSLSVCLQKTRPLDLTKQSFKLAVRSDFFLKKLSADKAKQQVETLVSKQLGRQVTIELSLDESDEGDAVAEALQVFEGAIVE